MAGNLASNYDSEIFLDKKITVTKNEKKTSSTCYIEGQS